jgi:hypothetical protein
MADPAALERLVRQVAREVRRRRAEHYGLRGMFYGALAAVVFLTFKALLGATAPVLAVAAILIGLAVGVGVGLGLAAPRGDLARLADRACGLEDRVATALEWIGRPDRPPLVEVLIQDATERVERIRVQGVVGRKFPRETRLLPVPVVAAVALAFLPALTIPSSVLPDFSGAAEQEAEPERARSTPVVTETQSKTEPVKQAGAIDERDIVRTAGAARSESRDRPELFKDTALNGQRPDFDRFLQKGDDRLRLLDQTNKLPDLESDYTRTEYKAVARQANELGAERKPEKISEEKLKDVLEQLRKMGQKSGSESQQLAEQGLRALREGLQEKALDKMSQALNAERQSDEERKGALNLQGGRRGDTARESPEGGESRQQAAVEQDEPGSAKGKLPGTGPGQQPKGDPTARLGAKGVETSIEGDRREGPKDSLDLNMFGTAASVPSRSPYVGAFEQYRKMMEDAIAREQVPRDYQMQVKEYFRALGDR